MKRLAVIASHAIQYHAPIFRQLAKRVDLHVFFAHRATQADQARAGFGVPFDWDLDLTSGYTHTFLTNVSRHPGTDHFSGCDTPEVFSCIREGRFEALLVMGWHLKSYLQGLFAAKQIGLPVLVRGDSHLATPRSNVKRAAKAILYPSFLEMFDAALYVGQRSQAYYEFYRYPADRLFFSPHCVDNNWFRAHATNASRRELRSRFRISDDVTVALFAGKLVSFKRPIDLVLAAALSRAKGTNVEVVIAGDGFLRTELTNVANSLRVPLHLLGFLNQSQMPSAYAASECLVLPSDGEETWGLVANEALACGRPIIVSEACGCVPDLATGGMVGQVFPVGDIEALSRCIDKLSLKPELAATIAKVSRRYSVESAVEGVCNALDKLRKFYPS